MNITYIIFFITIVISTLIITYWAARRSETPYQYYAAAGSLTVVQNSLAIAGDFISATFILGIVGTIAINRFDSFIYSIGFLVSYLVVLFFIVEPVHYLVQYSLGDVISVRFPQNSLRFTMAISTFI